jgi:hypothetical protein
MSTLQVKSVCLYLPALLVVLWPATIMAGYVDAILGDNPVAYWRLGESGGTTAADSTGHGHTGTAASGTNVALGGSAGALVGDTNKAGLFANSSTGFITAANSDGFSFDIADSFSIETWIKTSSTVASLAIVCKDDHVTAPNYHGYTLMLDVGKPLFQFEDGNTQSQYMYRETTSAINDGNWHHLVATYDGTNALSGMSLYVDGATVATITGQAGVLGSLMTTEPLFIGKRHGTTNVKFDGILDEVAIYGSELSAAKILDHYNIGMGLAVPEPSTLALATMGLVGLLAYAWRKRK